MDTQGRMRRLVKSLNYTVVLYLVAAAAMFYVLTSPTVSDAILNFCFGGIIPGTNEVLSPEVVIMGASVAIGLIVATVLIWLLVRSVRRRRAALVLVPANGEQIIFTRAHDEPSKQQPKVQHRPSRLAPLLGRIKLLQPPIARALRRVDGMLLLVVKLVAAAGRLVALLIFTGAIQFTTTAATLVKKAATASYVRIKNFLVWLEPHAQWLDTWLELRCRELVGFVGRYLRRSDRLRMCMSMLRGLKANVRNLFKTYL